MKTRIRWSSIGAPLLLGLAAWSCQVVGPRSELVGTPAFSLTLKDVNPRSESHGDSVALDSLWSENGVVLQFTASWCNYCREEMPGLGQLADEGVPVVFIGADEHGGADNLLIVAERSDVAAPILYAAEAGAEEVERHYPYEVLPATYVIGRDGSIRMVHEGAMSENELRAVVRRELDL